VHRDLKCSICLDEFFRAEAEKCACRLPECSGHYFHKHCIQQQLERRGKRSECSYFYILTEGTQPRSGTMTVSILPPVQLPLASYETSGTIAIEYNFPNGIQGPELLTTGRTVWHFSRIFLKVTKFWPCWKGASSCVIYLRWVLR
jgi:hypothetical protein